MQKKHITYLLCLSLLASAVFAADVDFAGGYHDYGSDTDSDGRYNYLSLGFQVSVSSAGNYYFYSDIMDSKGNSYQQTREYALGSGIQDIVLRFNGTEIYRNKASGDFDVNKIFIYRSCPTCMPPVPQYVNEAVSPYTTGFYNYSDFQKPAGNAAVYCQSSPCYADASLLSSRDNIKGKAEPNAPNTLDGCKDGTKGSFGLDESIESIKIIGNTNEFITGETVIVEIYAYCSMPGNRLNIAYANDTQNINWRVEDYKVCGSTGLTKFTSPIRLDSNAGFHAIRGIFSSAYYPGAEQESCITDDYADHDDAAFFVRNGKVFSQGWSLVSIPDIQDRDMPLSGNIGKVDSFFTIRDGKWLFYNQGNSNSNLYQADESDAFWIKSSKPFAVKYSPIVNKEIFLNLSKGWNLIGYPSTNKQNIANAFSGIDSYFDRIMAYKSGVWSSYDKSKGNNSLVQIEPGYGYLIHSLGEAAVKFNGSYHTYSEIPEEFTLSLDAGWNLVCVPLDASATLNQIFGDKVYRYDGKWAEPAMNEKAEKGRGYWVWSDNAGDVKLKGRKADILQLSLKKGINLIGTNLMQDSDVSIFSPVMNDIEAIYVYENGIWKTHIPNKISNSINKIKPGRGIFISAKKDISFSI
ncbi:hypothetical protein GF323_00100 [Candidatus Woesearchaeota archaeon]|nr:hypothetical protein [Candidatus Woesearchaeota archaeon]